MFVILKKGILGVSDYEQKTVVIIDFLDLLNIQEINETENKHKEIIFIDTDNGKIGLAVNEIKGIKTINLDNLKESSNFDGMPTLKFIVMEIIKHSSLIWKVFKTN